MLLGETRTLSLEFPERSLPITVDVLSLEQALVNVVSNAAHATKAGGHVRISLRGESRDEREHAVIQVADDGVGMSEAERQTALKPFFSTRTESGGTGLGLHIVETMARHAGGFVEIESTPGQGTRVRIWIPVS